MNTWDFIYVQFMEERFYTVLPGGTLVLAVFNGTQHFGQHHTTLLDDSMLTSFAHYVG